MTRLRYLLPLILMLLVSSALAADNLAPRPFTPVQEGFTTEVNIQLPFAADRLLVQLTVKAMARIDAPLEKGAQLADASTGLARIDALAKGAGVRSIERPYNKSKDTAKASAFGVDRWLMFHFDQAGDLPALADALRNDENVEQVSLDWVAFPAVVPSDPMYADHWGHNNTAQLPDLDWGGTYEHDLPNTVGTVGFDANAQAAWDGAQGFGSSSVVIAILDSGVDVGHPDLRQVTGYDYGDNDSNPDDDSSAPGHGTACAGVAAAMNNSLGAVGIAAGASIMPCKVSNSAGSMYFSSIQNAMYGAADNGADIISMSFSASISSDAATDAAILYAYNAGCVLLAATSNDNDNVIGYPAINQYVIGVGAASPCGDRKRSSSNSTEVNSGVSTDPNGYTCDGERWWGSNYGTTTQDGAGAVDIIAPTILPTTDIQGSGGYDSGDYSGFFNGTSCATPYAAGVCALIKSANPTWTPAQIRDQLVNTAQDVVNVESGAGWDRYSGYGMVDAAAAVGGGGPVAPVADFTGTPTSGTYPLNVVFTDLSSGGPDSWSWTFGDGGTSAAQNPSHTYTTAGTFTVSLTAGNAVDNDTVTKTNYITVTAPPAPTAAFTGTPTSGTNPLDVNFTDQSTGSPTSWIWTFGDGGTSTAQNPSHTYAAVGSYSVSLTATNAIGSDGLTKTSYITVTEPGVTSFVTASGETSVFGTVSGSYANTAASDGVNETITEELYTGHPRKRYSYAEHHWNFNLPVGGTSSFHLEAARSANSDGDNFLFEYSTDGVNWTSLATISSATEQTFNLDMGNLSGAVTVRATDTNRSWDMVSLDALYVDYMAFEVGDAQPVAPTADFSGTPTSGEYDLNVQFTDLSSGDPTSWSWTFGDGGTSTSQNPSHTYTVAGTYNVSLTASNAQGDDTATKTGYITVTEPGAGPTSMHVSDMSVGRVKSGPNYYGVCDVTVVDNEGNPVGGANVTASFDGITSGTVSGTTASDGTVTLQGSGMKRPSGEWCFQVTNITHSTLSYDSGSNVTTRSCEGGDVNNANGQRVLPSEFTLEQNHPNPFNPITNIKFNLPRDSHVRLTVYNVRGQAVVELLNESMGAGNHAVTWDARQHPSGVYFYRIEASGFSETRKMIMLK